ncbi:hypothetical protein PM035_16980 [Halorubrum ezzemoulense]|nr:hypothetical protein [Halorubrum ezzemoulense]MDB2269336.1 hypothetical protein [Halorubrum ezzemoulense]
MCLRIYVREYEDRVVAIDESPTSAFTEGFSPDEVASAVSNFLDTHEGLPFDNYTDLLENRSDKYRREDAEKWFETHQPDLALDVTTVMKSRDRGSHTKAPLMTYALLVGRDLGNGWEHTSINENQVAARNRDPNTEHDEYELTFLIPPLLDDAKNVIGLDGTPCKRQWDLCLGHSVKYWRVLTDRERGSYIRDVLNQQIYQMSVHAKVYSSGKWVKLEKDRALIKGIGEQERMLPDLITSQKAIKQYQDENFLNTVDEYLHYGDLIGSNQFGDSRLGIVIGSPHYGDTYLEKWGAFANEVVKWEGGRGMDKEYDPFGNELLEEMRESEVLQAVMRFGRDGDGAKIFVSTGAIPEWVPRAGRGKVTEYSDGMKSVLNAIEDRTEWKSSDLLTDVEGRKTPALDSENGEVLSGRRVQGHLTTLCERGFVSRNKNGNGYVYRNECVQDAPRGLFLEFE